MWSVPERLGTKMMGVAAIGGRKLQGGQGCAHSPLPSGRRSCWIGLAHLCTSPTTSAGLRLCLIKWGGFPSEARSPVQKEQGLERRCHDRTHSGKGPGLPSHPGVTSMNWGDRIFCLALGHFVGQKGTSSLPQMGTLSQESCPFVILPVRLQKAPSARPGS